MMNRKKPLIGIACGYVEDDRPGIIAELGFRGQSWNMVYGEYSECIEQAGCKFQSIGASIPELAVHLF